MIKTCIIILGMHRSGTSVVTGSVGLAGADLGPNLHGEVFYNPKGLFEDSKLNLLNLKYLYRHQSGWYRPFRYKPSEVQDSKMIAKLGDLFHSFSGEVIAIKDPRIALLLPLYQEALARQQIKPVYVVLLRNHHHIAHSLWKRDRMPLIYAYALTRFYYRQIRRFLSDGKSASVNLEFNQFLKQPADAIRLVFETAGLTVSPDFESKIGQLVSQDLNHGGTEPVSLREKMLAALSVPLLYLLLLVPWLKLDTVFTRDIITHDFDFGNYNKKHT